MDETPPNPNEDAPTVSVNNELSYKRNSLRRLAYFHAVSIYASDHAGAIQEGRVNSLRFVL